MKSENLYLRLALRDNNRLKISFRRESDPIWHYKEKQISLESLEKRYSKMVLTLNGKGMKNECTNALVESLTEMGRSLCDETLTPTVMQLMRDQRGNCLTLDTDEQLVHIPWELLCIDGEFLCQRFCIGRMVHTPQHMGRGYVGPRHKPSDMWIIADPRADLPVARQEGDDLCEFVEKNFQQAPNVMRGFLNNSVTSDQIKDRIRSFDIVHFAGHADFHTANPGNSGWKLTDGHFKAGYILDMAGKGRMPALVFSNACESATGEWRGTESDKKEPFGLANAFMMAGVKHYIGTGWRVMDKPSREFALKFYERLFTGKAIGEAVRLARLDLLGRESTDTCWASYVLFGDPSIRYFGEGNSFESQKKVSIVQHDMPVGPIVEPGAGQTEGHRSHFTGPKGAHYAHGETNGEKRQKQDKESDPGKGISGGSGKKIKRWILGSVVGLLSLLIIIFGLTVMLDNNPPTLSVEVDDSIAEVFDMEVDHFVATVIEKQIHRQAGIRLVERRSFNKIIFERQIKEIGWINQMRFFFSNILPATFKLLLYIDDSRSEQYVVMRLVNTRDGSVTEIFHEPLDKGKLVLDQRDRLSENLLKHLKALGDEEK